MLRPLSIMAPRLTAVLAAVAVGGDAQGAAVAAEVQVAGYDVRDTAAEERPVTAVPEVAALVADEAGGKVVANVAVVHGD